MTRHFDDYLAEKLQDHDFAAEYNALNLQYSVAEQVMRLRGRSGLTQAALADLVGTKQSGISRLENGSTLPSLSFLVRVADSLGADLEIRLVPKAPSFGPQS